MNEYLFLYGLALIWIIFAVVQDLRKREIANWLTFSLVAFVLAYRAIYAAYSSDLMFFIYGLIGVLLFVALGYLFYYSRVFAGGDAKLLFGIGGIFPYATFYDYAYFGLGFILLLFTAGVIYTLAYSAFLVSGNYSRFKKDFMLRVRKGRVYFIFSFVISLAILFAFYRDIDYYVLFLALIIILTPLLFSYVKSIERVCMIKLVSPEKLTEGDWLERDVSVKGNLIKKNFSGLNYEQILLLRKRGKQVWIKSGVPFAPSFLIALIVFFVLVGNGFGF